MVVWRVDMESMWTLEEQSQLNAAKLFSLLSSGRQFVDSEV